MWVNTVTYYQCYTHDCLSLQCTRVPLIFVFVTHAGWPWLHSPGGSLSGGTQRCSCCSRQEGGDSRLPEQGEAVVTVYSMIIITVALMEWCAQVRTTRECVVHLLGEYHCRCLTLHVLCDTGTLNTTVYCKSTWSRPRRPTAVGQWCVCGQTKHGTY